ncbi:hypothetical protein [Nostoc sphaeroides]|uniref:hypothetical protein n=1 Tax=Nostoc sphaeroides TaxID=446679 RepID=UPI002264CFAA|nr:hypothetical protein [Nostoc sphaeroides]
MPSEIAGREKKLKNPPLELHYLGDRVLRQAAKRVAKVDDEIPKWCAKCCNYV